MSFSKVYSAQTTGINAQIIDVEVDLSKNTLNAFTIVGLPDKAVEEARDRVSAAIKNSGYKSPKMTNQKTVISLAPAHIKKEGALFDLPISLAYLISTGALAFETKDKVFLGELSLDGSVRKIKGALPLAIAAKKAGFKEIYLPRDNADEAAFISDIKVFGVSTLQEVALHLNEIKNSTQESCADTDTTAKINIQEKTCQPETLIPSSVDFSDISGQESAKRGLEIAAAGKHNIAMYGPPGTGKTMLAKAFPALLPILSEDEIMETTGIHSIAGLLDQSLVTQPPFRAPHHTSSYVSVVGGGSTPKPGEVTLAHNGVLFMDEFPEFERRVIEALRQPLEERTISISRARGTEIFPANFVLITAMNPCPCGNYGSNKDCVCPPAKLMQYQRKISGPIMDRIDMWIEVGQIKHKELTGSDSSAEKTVEIKKRVAVAREMQKKRFESSTTNTNSEMSVRELKNLIYLSSEVKNILNSAATKMQLSARAYHRIIKLARTIADLDTAKDIKTEHILEALQYRPKQVEY